MPLVIGPLGIVSSLSNDSAGEATWNEGCIHIRRRARSVIMSIDFDLLTGPAVAAALYELADIQPQKICIAVGKNNMGEVLIGFEPAFRRICEIFAGTNIKESGSDTSCLPTSICGYFKVQHQCDPGKR